MSGDKEKQRILVVDDEIEVCSFLSRVLKRRGYEVDTAIDGEEALQKARESFYDLLITDLKMPKIDGLTVLKEIKRSNPYVEAIVVTGYPTVEKALKSIKTGAYDFITKPLDVEKIALTVDCCLEAQKMRSGFAKNEELEALFRITRETVSYSNLDSFFEHIFDLALNIVKARRGSFMVFDEKTEELSIKIAMGIEEEIVRNTRIKIGQGICGKVLERDEPLMVNDIENNPLFKSRKGKQYKTGSFISVPMKSRNFYPRENILGVLNVCDKFSGEGFTEREKLLLSILTSQAVAALENHKLHEELMAVNCKVNEIGEKLNWLRAEFLENEKTLTSGEMVQEMNHEIRNYLEILKEGIVRCEDKGWARGEEALATVKKIKKIATKVNFTIDSFLRYSRAARLRINKTDLHEILDKVIFLISLQAKSQKINLCKPEKNKPIFVPADQVLLRHALVNICINALAAMPRGGNLSFSLTEMKGKDGSKYVCLKIEHDGKGFPENIKSKVFSPFFTAGAEDREGLLGLSLARLIFKRHNGSLDIDSKVSKGTQFNISLPCL